MITALMAQVDLRFPSFEDNYAVSVKASNEPCVIIQICPSGLLFTKTILQLTCWHFTAKEEDTGLEKSKC